MKVELSFTSNPMAKQIETHRLKFLDIKNSKCCSTNHDVTPLKGQIDVPVVPSK